MPTLHVYPFTAADGPTNMAADEVLLEHAVDGRAAIRFYTWSEPTLSLGYFQPAAERLADPHLSELPWLRRASGGAAILHGDGDLTYALALPPGKPWHDGEGWICRMHHLIRDELADRGADPRMVVCGEEAKLGPLHCFLHQTPGDIRIGAVKVAGSAQRKSRGALLQHGSIRLAASRFAPMLSGVGVPAEGLAEAVLRRLEQETGWALEAAEWTDTDRERIAAGLAKYRSAEWNEKR